jgi:tripartite-type tricarboxylate transporter receptor subunit TctC
MYATGEANQVLNLLRVALATLFLAASALVAQEFPNRPVRIIVPFSPGGPADFLPRVIGAKLSQLWGQPVVVENRTGAAGNIGMSMGAKATADGYTLTSAPGGNLAVNPHMYPNLDYDVFKDFTPITLMASVQNVLVINPSVPANTVPELIALAKAQPGKLTFGSGGVGSYNHLGGELLKAMAQIDLLHVPYKGIGDATTAIGRPDQHGLRTGILREAVHRCREAARTRRCQPAAQSGDTQRADGQ